MNGSEKVKKIAHKMGWSAGNSWGGASTKYAATWSEAESERQ